MSIFPVDGTWIVTATSDPVVPPTATGAVAGAPGFFTPSSATGPATFAGLSALTPDPATAWLEGEYVRLGDDSTAHWNGSAWAVGVAGTTVTSGRLTVDFTSPGWAAEWMVGRDETYTDAQLTTIAGQRDVLVPLDGKFTAKIPLMRSANPGIQILIYQLGPFASVGESRTWPEEEFAHTSATMIGPDWAAYDAARAAGASVGDAMRPNKGNRIMTEDPFETFLMDAGNTAWRARARDRALSAANRHGYHGVLLDSMGQGAMRVGYVDGAAWNRATSAPYENADWNAASAAQVREVRAAAPSFFVTINGIGDQAAYPSTKVIGYEADLAMAERWLRNPHDPITAFPSASKLKQSIDIVVDMEANNKVGGGFATCTKLWSTPQPTVAQQDQWYNYAAAAFYCGTNGKSRFFFLKDGAAPAASGGAGASHLIGQPTPTPNIGTPTGAYVTVDGVHQRTFTNGFVAVNPTGANVTVTLPAGNYVRTDNGAGATGTIVVGSNRGVLLTKV